MDIETKLMMKPQDAVTQAETMEAVSTIIQLRQQLAAAKETDLLLRNLLCVIHRDGGHHITAHGLDQSVQDAMEVFYNLRDLPEQLAAALAACEAKDAILRGITLYRAFNGDDWPAIEATQALAIKPDASALKARFFSARSHNR